ncbi:hypothetical protein [Kitasatospora griseola]
MSNNPNPTGPTDRNPGEGDQAPQGGHVGDGPNPTTPPAGNQADALATEKSAREAAEKRAETAEAEANRLRRSNAANRGTDLDALKAEIRAEFTAELVRAKVEAAAAGRLRDPADALALVDLSALAGADGSVNAAAVTAAISKLVESKPYLAAEATTAGEAPKWGDVGAGPRAHAESEPTSPYERLRRVQRKS